MSNTIRIRDKVVVITFSILVCGLVSAVGFAVKAQHDLQKFREQSSQIEIKLRELEHSYSVIRQYTGSFSSLANPSDKPWLKDLDQASNGLFSMSMSARDFRHMRAKPTDLDRYNRMFELVGGLQRDTESIVGRLNVMAAVLQNHKELIRSIPSRNPVAGGRISSEFGPRLSPFGGAKQQHAGIDIAAKKGTPILAPADGTVTFAGNFNSLGKTLVLNHGNGVLTRYGHNSKLMVMRGQKVKRGSVIALVGNTGNSTGPHLHYEVWVNNRPANPRNFFFDVTESAADVVSMMEAENAKSPRDGMGGNL